MENNDDLDGIMTKAYRHRMQKLDRVAWRLARELAQTARADGRSAEELLRWAAGDAKIRRE